MLDEILNQLPEDKVSQEALDDFDTKASEHNRSVDGTGQSSLRVGMKLVPPDAETIEAKAYGDFATYRGREYARVCFLDYDTGKIVYVPEGRLNFFGHIVDENGERTGDVLQPQGGPADAWRKPGGNASFKARVQALSDEFYKKHKGKESAYILVGEPQKEKIEKLPWDESNNNYSEGEAFSFDGCGKDDKVLW